MTRKSKKSGSTSSSKDSPISEIDTGVRNATANDLFPDMPKSPIKRTLRHKQKKASESSISYEMVATLSKHPKVTTWIKEQRTGQEGQTEASTPLKPFETENLIDSKASSIILESSGNEMHSSGSHSDSILSQVASPVGLADCRIDSKFDGIDALAKEEVHDDPEKKHDDPEDFPLDTVYIQINDSSNTQTFQPESIPSQSRVSKLTMPLLRIVTRTLKPILSQLRSTTVGIYLSKGIFLCVCVMIWPLVVSGALAYKMSTEEAKRKLQVFFNEIWNEQK